MRVTVVLGLVQAIIALWLSGAGAGDQASISISSQDNKKVGSDQGLTFENIGKGLKSATKNIEEEIPKIGPAIGKTFKQITGQTSGESKKETPAETKPGRQSK
ncbi:hypothetical protein W02_41270 [Nitrospira sp. KM1]|uniref:hypothetical protein n=1 Tax=Nitrospira sp. KM1 TaxID=1936990 RepID=UPI0013A747AA|nr:hypothetical protein [Nitrospira sp. KM1]BCA56987.1 hypothetical protein W02_41270 [Nitrospira sp. KM1]